jgi:hypothetical protein
MDKIKLYGKKAVFWMAISPLFVIGAAYWLADVIVRSVERFEESAIGSYLSDKYLALADWADIGKPDTAVFKD